MRDFVTSASYPHVEPTVLRTEGQRGVRLKVALVEQRIEPKRTVSLLFRWAAKPSQPNITRKNLS